VRTRGRPSTRGTRILFYHRVSSERDELAVRPERFRAHMQLLSRAGLQAVDVLTAWQRVGEAGLVGLSFDDGYLDVAENAEPVLRELGFSATVFVATGVTDGRASFTWYEQQPPLIGWDLIRGLDAAGTLRFEPHTVTHPNLVSLEEAEARTEIVNSKRELEEHLGRQTSVFCYPAGLFNACHEQLVAEAGLVAATSCEPGVNTSATDRLALRRIQVDSRDSLFDFRAKVGGGHDGPLPLRGTYRRIRYGAS